MLIRIKIIPVLLLILSSVSYPQDNTNDIKTDIGPLIADLHKNHWNGAEIIGESPTIWDFGFTKPMLEILEIGTPAKSVLLQNVKDESIRDQIIILLGGVGDEQVIAPIIDAMIAKKDTKNNPRAKRINRAANIALTNISVADVIWHHGGGVVIERCPENPKECWSKWWKENKSSFSVKGITQSRDYSNYPNYGIYKNQ